MKIKDKKTKHILILYYVMIHNLAFLGRPISCARLQL